MATPTLAGSCSYPPGRRLLQTDSLQGSGYYICRCICAPRAGQPQARGGLSRVSNRPAAARQQLSRKCCRYDSRFALGCEAVQPVLSRGSGCAAQTVSDDAGLAVKRVWLELGRLLHKQGKLALISEL